MAETHAHIRLSWSLWSSGLDASGRQLQELDASKCLERVIPTMISLLRPRSANYLSLLCLKY